MTNLRPPIRGLLYTGRAYKWNLAAFSLWWLCREYWSFRIGTNIYRRLLILTGNWQVIYFGMCIAFVYVLVFFFTLLKTFPVAPQSSEGGRGDCARVEWRFCVLWPWCDDCARAWCKWINKNIDQLEIVTNYKHSHLYLVYAYSLSITSFSTLLHARFRYCLFKKDKKKAHSALQAWALTHGLWETILAKHSLVNSVLCRCV